MELCARFRRPSPIRTLHSAIQTVGNACLSFVNDNKIFQEHDSCQQANLAAVTTVSLRNVKSSVQPVSALNAKAERPEMRLDFIGATRIIAISHRDAYLAAGLRN